MVNRFYNAILQIIGVQVYQDFSAGEFLPKGVMGVAAACRRAVD